MTFTLQIATNVVLLRGWYNRLTVCLYGEFAEILIDNNQAPPPPPPAQHMMFGLQQPLNQMMGMPPTVPSTMEIEHERRDHGHQEMLKQGFETGGMQSNFDKGYQANVKEKGSTGDMDRFSDDNKDRSRRDTDGKDRGKDGDRRDKSDLFASKQKDGEKSEVKRSSGAGKSSTVKSVGETSEGKDSTKDGRDRSQVWINHFKFRME